MPEEPITDDEQEARASDIVHDDIMQRLLQYQRQLREGMTPGEAAEVHTAERPLIDYAAAEALAAAKTGTIQVVDITEAEAELDVSEPAAPAAAEPKAEEALTIEAEAESIVEAEPVVEPVAVAATQPVPSTDLTDRVAELEDTLARVSKLVGELRERFQDMAIASDERLAAIEDTLSGIGSAGRN